MGEYKDNEPGGWSALPVPAKRDPNDWYANHRERDAAWEAAAKRQIDEGSKAMAAAAAPVPAPTQIPFVPTRLQAERAANDIHALLRDTKPQDSRVNKMMDVTLAKGRALLPGPRMNPREARDRIEKVAGVYTEARTADIAFLRRVHPLVNKQALQNTDAIATSCIGPLFTRVATIDGLTVLANMIFDTNVPDGSPIAQMTWKRLQVNQAAYYQPFDEVFGRERQPIISEDLGITVGVASAVAASPSTSQKPDDRSTGVATGAWSEPEHRRIVWPDGTRTNGTLRVQVDGQAGRSSGDNPVWPYISI